MCAPWPTWSPVLNSPAEVRYYVNPRNEAWENELVIHNKQFLELGLRPITLSDGLLQEVIEVAARYR